MNEVSMTLLEQERNRAKNQIYILNRKVTLLKKFMSDFPNAEIAKARSFIAFVDHTNFPYKVILDKMNLERGE